MVLHGQGVSWILPPDSSIAALLLVIATLGHKNPSNAQHDPVTQGLDVHLFVDLHHGVPHVPHAGDEMIQVRPKVATNEHLQRSLVALFVAHNTYIVLGCVYHPWCMVADGSRMFKRSGAESRQSRR